MFERSADEIIVIAPNFNRRLSGVTSTIVRLIPVQQKKIAIAAFGAGLPAETSKISWYELLRLGYGKQPVVWHARRNIEMLTGLLLKYIFRKNFRLLFTSASQRHHSAYTKFLIRHMDRVVATSGIVAKYLERPCDVIYHGIDLQGFSPVDEEGMQTLKQQLYLPEGKLIGCFGRIRNQKGTDVFVDAMIRLLPEYPDWSALIMGRTTEQHAGFEKELRNRVADAHLSDRIIFGGEAPVEKMADYYRCLSLFVAPQRWEGFGLTPLEAMACGVAVVATKVGAYTEIIEEEKTGYLIEPGDADALVHAVKKVISSQKKLKQFSVAGRKRVENAFDIHTEADRLVEIYQDMLSR